MISVVGLKIVVTGGEEARRSLSAFGEALRRIPEGSAARFRDALEILLDGDGVFRVESSRSTADGATILQPINFQPSDAYRELVAAVGRDGDFDIVSAAHDWPILSTGGVALPVVAEGAGAAMPAPEGAA